MGLELSNIEKKYMRYTILKYNKLKSQTELSNSMIYIQYLYL